MFQICIFHSCFSLHLSQQRWNLTRRDHLLWPHQKPSALTCEGSPQCGILWRWWRGVCVMYFEIRMRWRECSSVSWKQSDINTKLSSSQNSRCRTDGSSRATAATCCRKRDCSQCYQRLYTRWYSSSLEPASMVFVEPFTSTQLSNIWQKLLM